MKYSNLNVSIGILLAALALLLGGGAYLNYQMAKTDTTGVSELTLANLEAMAFMGPDKDMDPDGVGPCCAPWENHCGTVHMENGLIYDVPGTPCN